jgi:hypothetical protein
MGGDLFRLMGHMQQLGLSPNSPKTTSRIRELLWPDVSDAVAAETAAQNGTYASFFIAGMTALFAALGLVPKVSLIDSLLFAVLGVGNPENVANCGCRRSPVVPD